ncbi:unnamed protein product [Mucor circinelloides]
MPTEVFKAPCFTNTTAYLHFATVEGASVFYNNNINKQLRIKGGIFSVHPAKYRNGQTVKYAFKQINFTGSSAAVAHTNTNTAATVPAAMSAAAMSAAVLPARAAAPAPASSNSTSVSAAVPAAAHAPAAAHSSE